MSQFHQSFLLNQSERRARESESGDSSHDVAPNLALPWILKLRYGMVAGEAAIILAMAYLFRLDFPVLWTLAPLAVVLASNFTVGRIRQGLSRYPQASLGAIFTLDTLSLTVILALTGGPMNPFSSLYLVQVTLSAVVLDRTWTWALGALSTICFGLLFWFHVPLAVLEMRHPEQGLPSHLIGMWIAFVLAAALIAFFTGKISDALRRREREVLALRDQVAKHERVASLATLAAGAAHELGTPLGTIAVAARELERYALNVPDNSALVEDSRLIRSEVERCRLILSRMSAQGAEPVGETPARVALKHLLETALREFPEEQRKFVLTEVPDKLYLVVPEQATIQSLTALIRNALDANIHLRPVVARAVVNGANIKITIQDRGSGIAEPVLRRIGEPFFTTKEPGQGMGLGTFLVRIFAERLGGNLSFRSVPGEGTTATLEFPVNT